MDKILIRGYGPFQRVLEAEHEGVTITIHWNRGKPPFNWIFRFDGGTIVASDMYISEDRIDMLVNGVYAGSLVPDMFYDVLVTLEHIIKEFNNGETEETDNDTD